MDHPSPIAVLIRHIASNCHDQGYQTAMEENAILYLDNYCWLVRKRESFHEPAPIQY